MKNPIEKGLKLIFCTQLVDLCVLNLSLFIIMVLDICWLQLPDMTALYWKYWFLANLSYLIAANVFVIVFHERMVRPEEVIGRGVRIIFLQCLLFLASLSLTRTEVSSFALLALLYVILLVALPLERLLLRRFLQRYRKQGHNLCSVVLIGYDIAIEEIGELMNDPWNGYKVQGMFTNTDVRYPQIAYLGNVSEALPYLKVHPVDEVYCSVDPTIREDAESILNYCDKKVIHFFHVPFLPSRSVNQLYIRNLNGILVLGVRSEPLSHLHNRVIKRAFDLTISSLFLITLYPIIYVIVAIITKLTSPGPVYFKQERTGINGKDFIIYKFRSMQLNKECDTLQAVKNDKRVTWFGKFLRHSNIDELPQFINVLKNDMSLIGPRPHMLKHTEYYSQRVDAYMVRHFVKPGITGWAQVRGYRGETTDLEMMEQRIDHDVWYLENWSVWLDLFILIKTVLCMFEGDKKAY